MAVAEFHHDAPDRLRHACMLVAQLHAQGRQVWIHCDSDALAARLDQMLWLFEPLAFIPHVREGHPLSAQTPVRIGRDPSAAPVEAVLLNLAGDVPAGFEQRSHIIEIVGRDPADRDAARARFVRYRQSGFDMQTFKAEADHT